MGLRDLIRAKRKATPEQRRDRAIRKARMPKDYHRKNREAKRTEQIARAKRRGLPCRHLEDPKGSQRWVETGRWAEDVD